MSSTTSQYHLRPLPTPTKTSKPVLVNNSVPLEMSNVIAPNVATQQQQPVQVVPSASSNSSMASLSSGPAMTLSGVVTPARRSASDASLNMPAQQDGPAPAARPVRSHSTSDLVGMQAQRASVMSYQDTLELYRANAKKTNDPQVQLDFARYLIEAAAVADDTEVGGKPSMRQQLQQEGLQWMKRLATQSIGLGKPPHPDAQFFLAECYGKGVLGLSINHDKAFALYLQASKQNHASSTYRAAVCYELGAGTRKDSSRAVSFYRKAAALGDSLAMHKLALILLHGTLGQQRNEREAITWLKRAAAMADESHPQALHDLALCYEPGGCGAVIPDEAYARDLFAQAAQLGYAPSQYKLGCCFEYGLLGCAIEPPASIEWYTRAAEQNDADALLALSGWYLTGAEGLLQQSDSDAYSYARKAAERQCSKAEYACGYYSEVGIGVRQDLDEAKRWYARAAAQGNKRAAQRLAELKRLGPNAALPPAVSATGGSMIVNEGASRPAVAVGGNKKEDCSIM